MTPGYVIGSDRIYYRKPDDTLVRASAKGLKPTELAAALEQLQQQNASPASDPK